MNFSFSSQLSNLNPNQSVNDSSSSNSSLNNNNNNSPSQPNRPRRRSVMFSLPSLDKNSDDLSINNRISSTLSHDSEEEEEKIQKNNNIELSTTNLNDNDSKVRQTFLSFIV